MTLLMVAADRGDAKIARLLVKHNADFQPSGPKACMHTLVVLPHICLDLRPCFAMLSTLKWLITIIVISSRGIQLIAMRKCCASLHNAHSHSPHWSSYVAAS